MYFNELELRAHYEEKRREMEKEVLGYKYSKLLRKKVMPKTPCCELTIQEVCCEN